MSEHKDLLSRLRARKILDAKAGHTQAPSDLELEAAAVIESLLFQLSARIGVARAEAKETLA